MQAYHYQDASTCTTTLQPLRKKSKWWPRRYTSGLGRPITTGSVPRSFVSHVKEQCHNLAYRKIHQWKSSVVLQGPLSTHPVLLAKAVKLLEDCVEVDKSCILQLGTWGILYFKGTSFTRLYTHVHSPLQCMTNFDLPCPAHKEGDMGGKMQVLGPLHTWANSRDLVMVRTLTLIQRPYHGCWESRFM